MIRPHPTKGSPDWRPECDDCHGWLCEEGFCAREEQAKHERAVVESYILQAFTGKMVNFHSQPETQQDE